MYEIDLYSVAFWEMWVKILNYYYLESRNKRSFFVIKDAKNWEDKHAKTGGVW